MKYNRVQFYFLILLVFTLVLSSNSIVAQSISKQQSLAEEFEELVYSKPNEALKIGLHLLKNSSSTTDKAEINLLIAKTYKVKGDYSNALNYLFGAEMYSEDLPEKLAIEIGISKSEILRALYLDEQSEKYFETAAKRATNIENRKENSFIRGLIALEKTAMYLHHQKYKEALILIQKQETESPATWKNSPDLNLWLNIAKGRIYCGLSDFDKGRFYFDNALALSNKGNVHNNYAEAYALSGLATVYFHQKDHQKAIDVLSKALISAKSLENLYLTETIDRQLIINYIAINDSPNYKLYNTFFLTSQKQVEDIEQESVNTAYNLISQEFANDYESKRKNYLTLFYIVLSFFIVALAVSSLVWLKFESKKKRLKEIINYLEITRNNLIVRYTEKKDSGKKISIPQETEQALLTKLKRFESSKRFTNNDMSLAVLAGQFETNTKYLSEVINKHYGVNFNTYINKLRINFIVQKLKSDPNFMNYKISYLAETCGFSSHSSFATIFKSITGIAPITFIELLKDENEIILK